MSKDFPVGQETAFFDKNKKWMALEGLETRVKKVRRTNAGKQVIMEVLEVEVTK